MSWGAVAAAARFDCDERAPCKQTCPSSAISPKRSLCRLAHAALAGFHHQHSPGFFRATTPILTAKESFRHPSPHECAEMLRLPKHLL